MSSTQPSSQEAPVIIFGTGRKGRLALEILQQSGFVVYGFLGEGSHDPDIFAWSHVPLLGTIYDGECLALLGPKCFPFLALEKLADNHAIFQALQKKKKFPPLNAIHPHTSLSADIRWGHGNIINSYTSIGAHTHIGNHCFLQGHSMLADKVVLHDFVEIGAGAILHSDVTVGEAAVISSGAILLPGVSIGAGVVVTPGTVVSESIPAINNTAAAKPSKDTHPTPAEPGI